jgi:hypothetical protein
VAEGAAHGGWIDVAPARQGIAAAARTPMIENGSDPGRSNPRFELTRGNVGIEAVEVFRTITLGWA